MTDNNADRRAAEVRARFMCVVCTSGHKAPGLLYLFTTPWTGDEWPEECPQCGASVGVVDFTPELYQSCLDEVPEAARGAR